MADSTEVGPASRVRRKGPGISFLDLPREIRDEVYRYTLVDNESSIPIKGRPLWARSRKWQSFRNVDYLVSNQYRSPFSISMALFFCNKTVSAEAAQTFYSYNTFQTVNSEWNLLCIFLQTIGVQNRAYLRRISIGFTTPNMVWQYADGNRSTLGPFEQRRFLPYDPVLHMAPRSFQERIVYDIDPASRAALRILGNERTLPVTFILVASHGCHIPGLRYELSKRLEESEMIHWPKLLERWRRELNTVSDGTSTVTILWTATCPEHRLSQFLGQIRPLGWEFVEFSEPKMSERDMWPGEYSMTAKTSTSAEIQAPHYKTFFVKMTDI